jgi:CRP/FNR family transcriptional regulator, cyclic AMP receptor protein
MAHSTSQVATLLGKTILFGPLEQADRMVVARQMLRAVLEPHQTIFTRGDAGGHVYLVVEGCVRLSVFSADGRLLSFKHASAGDVFGEIAALDGGSRSADAVALTRVVTMTLAAERLNQLVESNPRVARAAIVYLCQRLRDTSAQAETIALHAVETRLARFLLARVKPLAADTVDPDKSLLDLSISQSELASLIGASRQKVNAALGLLQDAGAISRQGRAMVCDTQKLAEFASAE